MKDFVNIRCRTQEPVTSRGWWIVRAFVVVACAGCLPLFVRSQVSSCLSNQYANGTLGDNTTLCINCSSVIQHCISCSLLNGTFRCDKCVEENFDPTNNCYAKDDATSWIIIVAVAVPVVVVGLAVIGVIAYVCMRRTKSPTSRADARRRLPSPDELDDPIATVDKSKSVKKRSRKERYTPGPDADGGRGHRQNPGGGGVVGASRPVIDSVHYEDQDAVSEPTLVASRPAAPLPVAAVNHHANTTPRPTPAPPASHTGNGTLTQQAPSTAKRPPVKPPTTTTPSQQRPSPSPLRPERPVSLLPGGNVAINMVDVRKLDDDDDREVYENRDDIPKPTTAAGSRKPTPAVGTAAPVDDEDDVDEFGQQEYVNVAGLRQDLQQQQHKASTPDLQPPADDASDSEMYENIQPHQSANRRNR